MNIRPRGQWPKPHKSGSKYDSCYLCSPNKYHRVTLEFTSGSVEPEEDETLTGAESSDTGIVVSVQLYTGSWAGGDATGQIELSGCTGISDIQYLLWGTEDEVINGSVGGDNILTLDGYGHRKTYGMLYPDELLVEIDTGKYAGRKLCIWHANAFLKRQALDDAEIDLSEDLREEID